METQLAANTPYHLDIDTQNPWIQNWVAVDKEY